METMQTSATECEHPEFTAEVTDHPWEDGSGVLVDAAVRCTTCGVHYYNARDARADGVFKQVDVARRAALDAWHSRRDVMLPCPFCSGTTLIVGAEPGATRPRVVCAACGARGPLTRSDANREAIANWNRRHGSLIEAQEKLRAGLQAYIEDAVKACGTERTTGEPLAQTIERLVAELHELRSERA